MKGSTRNVSRYCRHHSPSSTRTHLHVSCRSGKDESPPPTVVRVRRAHTTTRAGAGAPALSSFRKLG